MRSSTEYQPETAKGLYYVGKYITLVYDFNSDEVLEMYENYTECEQELIISELRKEKQNYDNNQGYDVRLEQGLYGYGY